MGIVLDYNNLIATFITYLNNQNTTTATYDLSSGLTKRVQKIEQKDPSIYNPKLGEFPYIFVTMGDKEEDDVLDIGASPARRVMFDINVTAAVSQFSDSDSEVLKLIRNIETNIRNNRDLDSYTTFGQLVDMKAGSGKKATYGQESAFNQGRDLSVVFDFILK